MTAWLPIVAITVLTVLCWLRVRRYRRWFRLPRHRSDALQCTGQHQVAAELALARGGFELPRGLLKRGQTVLLRFSCRATILGHLFDPYIEVDDGAGSYRQYFERGAVGQRYLNVSPSFQRLHTSLPSRVALRGRWMTWDREARLCIFGAPVLKDKTVLVLAPHPDDAEIAAFGIYASHRSWVATITAGEKGTGNLPATMGKVLRNQWAARLRVADSLTVPHLGDVPLERCISLVYPDGTLDAMHRDPNRPFQLRCEATLTRSSLRAENKIAAFKTANADCTWHTLLADLRRVLELTLPEVVVCPHPGVDSHPDHVFTAVALAEVLHQLPHMPPPRLLLYGVHSHGAPSYPFGPAESVVCLPPGLGADLRCESVYSHPLDPDMQQAKYFAVEGMHGARRHTEQASSARKALKNIMDELAALLSGMDRYPSSLLRRAVRPNEIYYTLAAERLASLVQDSMGNGATAQRTQERHESGTEAERGTLKGLHSDAES